MVLGSLSDLGFSKDSKESVICKWPLGRDPGGHVQGGEGEKAKDRHSGYHTWSWSSGQ